MAELETPPFDSMDSMPPPSEPESGVALQSSGSKVNDKLAEVGQGGDIGGKKAKKTKKENEKKKDKKPPNATLKNGCQKCCGSIMNFVANDSIYGSFFGPHPPSFFCLCTPCKKCISRTSVMARSFCVASIATKAMNFIMLGVVTLLACFFIVPWPVSHVTVNETLISHFHPCQKKDSIPNGYNGNDSHKGNGGCAAHAGHFMVYRCFLAFAFVMLTNFFAMMDVTSTTEDPYRKRIHHGFWLYKYLYLFLLLLIFFLFLHGSHDPHGYFEFTMSILGNLAHVVFSMLEFTVILDIVEACVISIVMSSSSGRDSWANFVYSFITCLIFIADIIAFLAITMYFGYKLKFDILEIMNKAERFDSLDQLKSSTFSPEENVVERIQNLTKDLTENRTFATNTWPHTNCLEGAYDGIDSLHMGLIAGVGLLAVLLVVVMFLKKQFSKRYPFQGWLQVAVIILFDLFYLWSALFNSPHIHSRPRCNPALNLKQYLDDNKYTPQKALQDGSHDAYFRFTGFFHGMIVVFTLLFYAVVHGPRSKTAPLSLGFRHFITGGYDRVPVFPDPKDSPPEFNEAVAKLEVWDDEQEKVGQSWSMFYFWMIFGSLSLMMSMTNFTDPWAPERYSTSEKAMVFKYITLVAATFAYIFMLICPCSRVYHAYEAPKRRYRVIKRTPKPTEDVAEAQMEEPEEEEIEVEETVSADNVSDNSSQHVKPAQCGCLF